MKASKKLRAKLIFNPFAGGKRNTFKIGVGPSIEEIKALLAQYQIPTDFAPTKYPGHATQLAKKAAENGYSLVIAGFPKPGELAALREKTYILP